MNIRFQQSVKMYSLSAYKFIIAAGDSGSWGFQSNPYIRSISIIDGVRMLAPDHVHIYVESDGEKSVETIIQEIKEFSENAIVERFPDAGERVAAGIEIWDEAYFAETMG